MNTRTNQDDYWTQQHNGPSDPSGPYLNVKSINGVEPLDSQFGDATPKTVPEGLRELLFGQARPTKAVSDQATRDQIRIPQLQTYAILDGAKVAGLRELLAASGLEHRCLFKGHAFDELKDVAPWIVRIEETNNFTRNLFTASNAGWHLWGKEPGVYIRSRGTLDDIWGHFRKFTRVQDEHGKWFYFRFWETDFSALFFGGNPNSEHEARAKFGGLVQRIICHSQKGCFTIVEPCVGDIPTNIRLLPKQVTHYIRVFEHHRWSQFLDSFTPKMAEKLTRLDWAIPETKIRKLCEEAKSEDYHFEDEIETYVLDAAAKLSKQSTRSTL